MSCWTSIWFCLTKILVKSSCFLTQILDHPKNLAIFRTQHKYWIFKNYFKQIMILSFLWQRYKPCCKWCVIFSNVTYFYSGLNMKLPKHHFIMLFNFKQGKNAITTALKICKVYGETALSDHTFRRWFVRFDRGDFSVED